MTIQTAESVDNAALDARIAVAGTNPILRIFDNTEAVPADVTAANGTNVQLAEITLPDPWLQAAGAVAPRRADLTGTWQDASADAAGTAAYYRIYDPTGVTCLFQGSVTATSGGGDLEVNNVVFAAGQQFNITAFDWSEGNA